MKTRRVHILALISLLSAATPTLADGTLSLHPRETRATVEPRAAQHALINLPTLEFVVELTWRCRDELQSVTLSVADTLQALGAEVLEGEQPARTTIRVPSQQLKLVAHPSFCVADAPQTADELYIPGLATAHASLRCNGDDGPSVVFASVPLPVTLACERPPARAQEASTDR
jgi:hypothetical protein